MGANALAGGCRSKWVGGQRSGVRAHLSVHAQAVSAVTATSTAFNRTFQLPTAERVDRRF
jgi:hypothetical protein